MQNLNDLPTGATVFADANILAYYFAREDDLARSVGQFLARSAEKDIEIVTSSNIAAELIHRLMIAEIVRERKLEPRKAVAYLKGHPDAVKTLRESQTILSRLHNRYGVDIIPIGYIELHASRAGRSRYGLLANDSVLVAVMQRYKIPHLATNDRDFDRVKEIQVWSP